MLLRFEKNNKFQNAFQRLSPQQTLALEKVYFCSKT